MARVGGRGLWWATRPDPEPEVIPNSPSPSREAAGKQAGQGEVLSDQAGGRAGAMIKALRERERTKSCTSQQQQANSKMFLSFIQNNSIEVEPHQSKAK